MTAWLYYILALFILLKNGIHIWIIFACTQVWYAQNIWRLHYITVREMWYITFLPSVEELASLSFSKMEISDTSKQSSMVNGCPTSFSGHLSGAILNCMTAVQILLLFITRICFWYVEHLQCLPTVPRRRSIPPTEYFYVQTSTIRRLYLSRNRMSVSFWWCKFSFWSKKADMYGTVRTFQKLIVPYGIMRRVTSTGTSIKYNRTEHK